MKKFRVEPGKGIVKSTSSIYTSRFENLRCKGLESAIQEFADIFTDGDVSRIRYQETDEGMYDIWVSGDRVDGPSGRYIEKDNFFTYGSGSLRRKSISSSVKMIYPFKMDGRYADDFEITVGGMDEDDCMYRLIKLQDKHGELVWYSGYSDEDYVDGEYVGRENFIYSSRDSYLSKLRALKDEVERENDFPEGTEVLVNNERKCVDIVFPDMSGYQGYIQEGDPYNSFGYKYMYVGPNKGEYKRVKYPWQRRSWKDDADWKKVENFNSESPIRKKGDQL